MNGSRDKGKCNDPIVKPYTDCVMETRAMETHSVEENRSNVNNNQASVGPSNKIITSKPQSSEESLSQMIEDGVETTSLPGKQQSAEVEGPKETKDKYPQLENINVKLFQCDACCYFFVSMKEVLKHACKKTSSRNNLNIQSSKDEQKLFATSSTVIRHVVGDNLIKCSTENENSSMILSQSKSFETQSHIHSEGSSFICDKDLGNTIKPETGNEKTVTVKTENEDNKVLVCSSCNVVFKDVPEFNRHLLQCTLISCGHDYANKPELPAECSDNTEDLRSADAAESQTGSQELEDGNTLNDELEDSRLIIDEEQSPEQPEVNSGLDGKGMSHCSAANDNNIKSPADIVEPAQKPICMKSLLTGVIKTISTPVNTSVLKEKKVCCYQVKDVVTFSTNNGVQVRKHNGPTILKPIATTEKCSTFFMQSGNRNDSATFLKRIVTTEKHPTFAWTTEERPTFSMQSANRNDSATFLKPIVATEKHPTFAWTTEKRPTFSMQSANRNDSATGWNFNVTAGKNLDISSKPTPLGANKRTRIETVSSNSAENVSSSDIVDKNNLYGITSSIDDNIQQNAGACVFKTPVVKFIINKKDICIMDAHKTKTVDDSMTQLDGLNANTAISVDDVEVTETVNDGMTQLGRLNANTPILIDDVDETVDDNMTQLDGLNANTPISIDDVDEIETEDDGMTLMQLEALNAKTPILIDDDDESDMVVETKNLCDICCIAFENFEEFCNHYDSCAVQQENVTRTLNDHQRIQDNDDDLNRETDMAEIRDAMGEENSDLICGKCGLSYDSFHKVSSHKIECVKSLECINCAEIFKDRPSLMSHISSCSQRLHCDLCFETFDNEAMLFEHSCNTADDSKSLGCANCNQSFTSMDLLMEHTEVCNHLYHCRKCLERFDDKDSLKNHECSGKRLFTCGMCGKTFKKRHVLKGHMKIHSDERDFACTICSRSFRHKHQLKNHMGMHTEERSFKCDQCEKSFKYQSNLHKHVQTHLGIDREKKYVCQYCDRAFFNNYHKKRHEETHLQNKEKKFKCEKCQAMFYRKDSLLNHTKRVHEGNGPKRQIHECDDCGQNFCWKKHLRNHVKSVHGKEEFYDSNSDEEDQMEKEFDTSEEEGANSIDDNDEIVIQNMKKKGTYECKKCDRVFRTLGNFERHMKLMHDNEMDTSRDDRNSASDDNDEVKKQNMKKKGTYECKECDRIFRTPGNFKRHMTLKHDKGSHDESN